MTTDMINPEFAETLEYNQVEGWEITAAHGGKNFDPSKGASGVFLQKGD